MCYSQLVSMLMLPAFLAINTVYGDFVLNVTIPERNNPVRATCSYSFANASSRVFFTNPKVQITPLTVCGPMCFPQNWPSTSPPIYKFGISATSSWVDILSLNRTRDQGVWKCGLGSVDFDQNLNLTVYTSPVGINFVSSLQTDIDLAETFLSVQCQTTECAYPAPTMTWYYEIGIDTVPINEGTTSDSSGTSCSQDELKYTTYLNLARGTVFPGNVPMTAKLRCGIRHDTFVATRFSQLYVNVSFAVALTYVNISGTTNITDGISTMFTCMTSTSRPLATVQWFIGNTLMTTIIQNFNRTDSSGSLFVESRLTFNPDGISHHGKNISCQAYTIDSSNVQRSDYLALYVKVPLTYVTMNGTRNITQGTAANFTCITSISQPLATVQWFIGNLPVTSGIHNIDRIDSSGLHFVESRLTFDPDGINHHGKEIFCQAYNIDPNNLTISTKLELFVFVYITNVTLNPAGSVITFLDGEEKNLTCTSSPGRPQPIIRWWLDRTETKTGILNTTTYDKTLIIMSSELHLILNKSHMNNQVYCDARVTGQPNIIESSKATVNVWYQPDSPAVQTVNGDFPWLENRTGILDCKTNDLGNPQASVTWPDIRGVMNNLNQLVFSNLSAQDDGKVVYCELHNNFTSIKGIHVVSPKRTLNVEYTATITLNASKTTVMVEEGKTLSITCTASGNPAPVVQWQNIFPPSSFLHIPDIRRNRTGHYTCVASTNSTNYGGILLIRKKTVAVSVQYSPDVMVELFGSVEVNSTAVLMCVPKGEPSQYTFHQWIHFIDQTEVRRLNGNNTVNSSTLTLSGISTQDMGKYICIVNNSVTGMDGKINQTGETDIHVEGVPVAFVTDTAFIGEINMSASIRVPFFSNPNITALEFFKTWNNTPIANDTDTKVYCTKANISTVFHDTEVVFQGMAAVLDFINLKESDFGQYTLVLYNSKGNTAYSVYLNASAPPSPVEQFYFYGLEGKYMKFCFVPGFNGGHEQTFTIQFKPSVSSDESWKNTSINGLSEMNETYRFPNRTFVVPVEKLQPGRYIFRMFSVNKKNIRLYSKEVLVYIEAEPNADTNIELSVAGIAGGIGGGVLVILITGVVIFLWRRHSHTNKAADDDYDGELQERERPESGLVDNPVYEKSSPRLAESRSSGATEATYASVIKPKNKVPVLEDQRNLYSQVEKTKKRKNKKGEMYENATLFGRSSSKEENVDEGSGNSEAEAPSENVYENPGAATSNGTLMKKDGLLYADLMLNPPTTKNGKPVIRGLENCTEYADIAYGKRGEPLPDNEEEK